VFSARDVAKKLRIKPAVRNPQLQRMWPLQMRSCQLETSGLPIFQQGGGDKIRAGFLLWSSSCLLIIIALPFYLFCRHWVDVLVEKWIGCRKSHVCLVCLSKGPNETNYKTWNGETLKGIPQLTGELIRRGAHCGLRGNEEMTRVLSGSKKECSAGTSHPGVRALNSATVRPGGQGNWTRTDTL